MNSQLFKFNLPKKPETQSGQQDDVDLNLSMSDETFKNLREEIYKQCGIYFTESKKYLLEGRIAKRVVARNLTNFEQYIDLIKSSLGKQELNNLFEAVTINETYFFRADQQFEAFEKVIVPEIIKLRTGLNSPVFRIWSAASSTGEEAYTLAMIILERLKPIYPNVQFQIVASDINRAVLDTARKGVYKEYAIRNVPPAYMSKYFTKANGTYNLTDNVKSMVKFINLNLYDAVAMKTMSSCDVIFCANVLIYFDIPSKQQVVSYLYDSLNKGGYLFIGYSESLHGISKAFKLVHLPKSMAYKKE
jgi:chemotaxis protein methyltransferase CheR